MLKRNIKYENFDGETVTEAFYFNLTEAEVIEWEVEYGEGLAATMQRIIDTNDRKELVKEFKGLILRCYGVRSEDGKRFVKSEQLREEFSQTAAYPKLFMELAQNAVSASQFMMGVLPKEMAAAVAKANPQDKPVGAPPVPRTVVKPPEDSPLGGIIETQ